MIRRFVLLLVLVSLVLVSLVPPALAQDVTQCRADLTKWLPVFRAVNNTPECQGAGSAACPFSDPVKDLTGSQLLRIMREMDGCAKLDAEGDRYTYQRVSTRAASVVIQRMGYFFEDTKQTERYSVWEEKHAAPPFRR